MTVRRSSRLSENLAAYLPDRPTDGVTKLSISLPTELVDAVRATAAERGTTVSATIAAALRMAIAPAEPLSFENIPFRNPIDPAVADWLVANGVRLSRVRDDEWQRRMEAFLDRRRALASEHGWTEEEVAADVDAAVAEVRGERAARRR